MEYWYAAGEVASLAAVAERKAAKFYKMLNSLTDNDMLQAFFMLLSRDEDKHEKIFMDISMAHCESSVKDCYSVDIRRMFLANLQAVESFFHKDYKVTPVTMEECLDFAMEMETHGIAVYRRLTDVIPDKISGIVADILREEKDHVRKIWDVQERMGYRKAM